METVTRWIGSPGVSRSVWASEGAVLMILFVFAVLPPGLAMAQKEVTSDIYGSRSRETKSHYYGEYEVKTRTHLPVIVGRRARRPGITFAPTAETVRGRRLLADAHIGLKFYYRRTCIKCHPQQVGSLHKERVGITCRQCHGEEPIAGIMHYNSPMHPKRRYAYVCAKCHKGSSASFATYKVHEPSLLALKTQKAFPLLFYAVWFMVLLAVGTFASLLPQMFMWGAREFLPPGFRWSFKDLMPGRRKQDDQD